MALSLGLPSFIPVRPTQIRVLSCRSPVYAQLKSPRLERRSANYKSTIWHDNFIQSLSSGDEHEAGRNMERVSKLKEEVRQMLYKEELLRDKLELVDAMQQLGVAYHFKDEINCVITKIHESIDQILMPAMDDDLYVVSLFFRLLRMHGFSVQEDIFKKYLDNNGHCKAMLSSDIKGILSLYEASYLAKEGEETLEMAKHFATKQLTDFLESSKYNDSRLKEHVSHALDHPLHWRIQRVHTHWFIDQYKKDEQIRPALWELAVLDFNAVQNLYKEELKNVSRWWTNLRLYEKLPFIRDRLVECYLVSVECDFEPEHDRIAQTKATCFIVAMDDIYDIYGSLDELEVFADAIEQWDVNAAMGLPENMQMCLLALFSTVQDQSYEIFKEKQLNVFPYLRRVWTDLCKAYLVEARWYHNGYMPTLEEYLENAWVSTSTPVFLAYVYCFNDYVTAKDLEHTSSGYRDMARYTSMIVRLLNDLETSNDEQERGDISKSVQCYMHDKKVTESIARQKIKEMIWKYSTLLNGEIVGSSAFQKLLRNNVLNSARIGHAIYKHGDGFGKPNNDIKHYVTSVLLEQVKF